MRSPYKAYRSPFGPQYVFPWFLPRRWGGNWGLGVRGGESVVGDIEKEVDD